MKQVLLVGFGYWGKIILKNMLRMNAFKVYTKIWVYDTMFKNEENISKKKPNQVSFIKDIQDIDLTQVSHAFVIVPSTQHFEICKKLLEHKTNVFCEKPLCSNSWQASQLYDIAQKNDAMLFTDWIFTYNDQVNQVKKDYESGSLGKIKSVRMNRLNNGPERFDVDARWDLASHDVSIIEHIFLPIEPIAVSWKNYKQNEGSSQNDSTYGFIDYGEFKVFIDASWEYGEKDRSCIFEFENKFVYWDDTRALLKYYNEDMCRYVRVKKSSSSPLENSIKAFLEMDSFDMGKQKELTINTLKTLEK